MADGEGSVEQLMDEHRTADVVNPSICPGQLQSEAVEADSVVFIDGALVLDGEKQIHVHARQGYKGAATVDGLDGEASVELGQDDFVHGSVGGLAVRDAAELELLRDPGL